MALECAGIHAILCRVHPNGQVRRRSEDDLGSECLLLTHFSTGKPLDRKHIPHMALERHDSASWVDHSRVPVLPSSDEQPRLGRVVQGIDMYLVLGNHFLPTHIPLAENLCWELHRPVDNVQ